MGTTTVWIYMNGVLFISLQGNESQLTFPQQIFIHFLNKCLLRAWFEPDSEVSTEDKRISVGFKGLIGIYEENRKDNISKWPDQ